MEKEADKHEVDIFQYRLTDNLILKDCAMRKEVRWYDLIPCQYEEDVVYIPAAFLKVRGCLPKVDLGDELEYRLDFSHYKKNDKTIDELFADFAIKGKHPSYRKMLEFSRFLYWEKASYINDLGENIDQVEKQFRNEYNRFRRSFFGVGKWKIKKMYAMKFQKKEKKRVYLTKRERALRQSDILKMFILYRSLKIKNLKNILDTKKKCLPNEAKVNVIDNIFLYQKDTVSVAPLDGRQRSLNENFIKKFYALLWVNSNRDDYELKTLLDYLLLLRKTKDLLLSGFWTGDYFKRPFEGKIFIPSGGDKDDIIIRDFWVYQYHQKMYLKENLLCHNIKIPVFLYCIAKLYIRNEMKAAQWHQIIDNIICKINKDYPNIQQLRTIDEAVANVNIESKEDFINLFNNKKSAISNENQNIILDIIFPNNTKLKSAKRRILQKHIEAIVNLCEQFRLRCEKTNIHIETSYCCNLVIYASLYFKLKKIVIPKKMIKTFQSTVFDDRNKELGSLYKQSKKNDMQAYYYYKEISEAIVSRYYVLFNLRKPVDADILNKYRVNTFEAIFDFLKAALKEIYKFTIV